MKRVILDATTLTAFQLCEEYYNLRHNHNLIPIGGKGRGLEGGSMMHEMLATYYRTQMAGLHRDDRIASAISTGQTFITGCEHCINPDVKCIIHTDHPFTGLESLTIEEAHDVLGNFQQYVERWKNDSWTTVNVEYVKGKVIYEDDELSLLWKAKIDWEVDNLEGIFSVDHKTFSRRERTLNTDNQFIGQSIVTEQTKVFVNKIGTQKTVKPEEKFERITLNYTKNRMAEWINECASYAYDLLAIHESGSYRHRFKMCSGKYGPCRYNEVCEGEPSDRQRILLEKYKIADKVWDVTNDEA